MTDETIQEKKFENEIVLIDKPEGWTSFDVVKKFKSLTKVKKVGHAGTLDPFATGLLVLATGKKTKEIEGIQNGEKEYRAKICLGATTKSLDTEFLPEEESFADIEKLEKLTLEKIQNTVDENFLGKIKQTPPLFSAIKINGQRAYKIARGLEEANRWNDQEVENILKRKTREVEIFEFKIKDFGWVNIEESNNKKVFFVDVLIKCSKGTYIRSLARDLGEKLRVGGYLLALRRNKIGEYNIEKALKLEDIAIKPNN